METHNKPTSGNAALIAGISILIMVLTVPVAEFGIFPQLFSANPKETFIKLENNQTLFILGIFLNFITIIGDLVAAWALYIFLSPVNKMLSLLSAWFRLLFASFYLIALYNLIQIAILLNMVKLSQSIDINQVSNQITFYFHSFKTGWSFALILFGIYLILLGILVIKSNYIPNLIGVLLVIAGIGYFLDNLAKFFLPNMNTEFLTITFFGELVFMCWLLTKGQKTVFPISI